MKKSVKTALCALILSLGLLSNAQAAIVANGDFTTDTDTGLDWLDLDFSQGLSLNQVATQLGVGGLFEGYQVATLAETHTFLTNVGWIGPFDPSNNFNIGFVASFKAQTTSFTNDPAGDLGGFSDPLQWDSFTNDPLANLGFTTYSSVSPISPDFSDQNTGTFLVRSSITTVPVPASFWLLGSGLVGLMGVAGRQVQQ